MLIEKHQTEEQRMEVYRKVWQGVPRNAGAQHPKLKQVKSVQNNTKPNPQKLIVAEGIWALERALEHNLKVDSLIFAPGLIQTPEAENILCKMAEKTKDIYMVSSKVFETISEKDNPDGTLAMVALPYFELDDIPLTSQSVVVILDAVEIPGNVGTIIRSVDGAGGAGLILVNRRARLTHPKLIKSSQGSNMNIPIVDSTYEETIAWLHKNKFTIYLTDTDASLNYYEAPFQGRVALVAGSERYGISKPWYEEKHVPLKIPMKGGCDSLNVAIATTIMLYEATLRPQRTRGK